MKYLVSQVESWREEIAALPSPDPGRRKVGKREAIVLLAKDLQAAARRGFSTAELLEVLEAKGLKVHVDTLRAAMRRAGRGTTARTRRKSEESKVPQAASVPGTSATTEPTGESHGEPAANDTIERSAASRPVASDAVEVAPANGEVGKSKSGDAEHELTSDATQAGAAAETAGKLGRAAEDADGAGGRAGASLTLERGGGAAARRPTAAGVQAVKGEREKGTGAERARASPAAAPGRGTFTPRNDSDEI